MRVIDKEARISGHEPSLGLAPVLIGLLMTLVCAPSARAQVRTLSGRQDHAEGVVIPGERYAGSSFRRFFLGDHYRDLWTTPIAVPFLDLASFAGGLTPEEAHSGSQTRSLRFQGADGRSYQFRAVFKNPTARLDPELQGTLVADLLQDGASASHPVGALVVAPLLDVAGVLHPEPYLAIMPDDPALGPFRTEFAGVLGFVEERPNEARDGRGGFQDASRVVGATRLFERIDDGPDDLVDARAFLTARLMDIYVGDRDRHRDNWRWALLDDSGPVRIWTPISRDHDEAFVKLDGALLRFATKYYPQLTSFAPEYGNTLNLNWHAREVDRRFLAGLDRQVWDSTAVWLQSRLSDQVLTEAVATLPVAMLEVGGEDLLSVLQARRDGLADEASRYYGLLADEVEIHATDADEVARITRVDDHILEVMIRARDCQGCAPYFLRHFDSDDTREVRINLWGGKDSVVVEGDGEPPIELRVVGGKGRDQLIDRSRVGGVKFYDSGDATEVFLGLDSRIDRRSYDEWVGSDLDRYPPREWGTWTRPFPFVLAGPELGVLFGATIVRTRYGFRRSPYGSEVRFRAGLATGEGWGMAGVDLDVRALNSNTHATLRASVSGIEILGYYGRGNDTEATEDPAFFRVPFDQVRFEPSVAFRLWNRAEMSLGPRLRYSDTDDDDSPFFSSVSDTLYGAGRFGRLGAEASVVWATRPTSSGVGGVTISAQGGVWPALWDVESMYGELGAEVRAYVTAPRSWLRPTLALRGGGEKHFGPIPFQDATFLGGRSNLRGFSSERFTGDASLYGGVELRIRFAHFRFMLPGNLGLLGLVDAGRVYVDGESPGGWHTGFGGGLWIDVVDASSTTTLTVTTSSERTTVNLGFGFAF